ncbi:MAG: hypothetical protein F6K19_42605 [Cyanothece sp. SIO1E1]|nr:hypothetical protein [Cyanothece sp. SIO1E1]
MADRFSRVLKGGELKRALDNYIGYLQDLDNRQTSRFTGAGTPQARAAAVSAGVRLFGADIPTGNYILTSAGSSGLGASAANFDGLADIGTGTDRRVVYDASVDPNEVIAPPGSFKSPAKLSVFVPTGGASSYVRSKFTQLYYAKTPGRNYTTPIGRVIGVNGDLENFANARAQIKASLKGTGPGQFRRVSIREENYEG